MPTTVRTHIRRRPKRHVLTPVERRKGIKKLLRSESKRARPLQVYWRKRGKREGWL